MCRVETPRNLGVGLAHILGGRRLVYCRPARGRIMAKPKVAKRKSAKPKAKDVRQKKSPEERIEDLKRRAEELSGGQMTVGTLDDYPSEVPEEVEEGFWKHVVDYEEAPWTTNFQQLENAGVSLPAPDSLKDEELTAKLWEVIQKLALRS